MGLLRVVSEIFNVEKYRHLEIPVKVTQGRRNQNGSFRHLFHSNHLPILHRFRYKRRFQSKITNFPYPRVFCAPAEGVPLGIGYGRMESKKLE